MPLCEDESLFLCLRKTTQVEDRSTETFDVVTSPSEVITNVTSKLGPASESVDQNFIMVVYIVAVCLLLLFSVCVYWWTRSRKGKRHAPLVNLEMEEVDGTGDELN